MLKKPLRVDAGGYVVDAMGGDFRLLYEPEQIVRELNAFDGLLEALTDLLCFTSPGGEHGSEPDHWSDESKRICRAARTAIARAKGAAS